MSTFSHLCDPDVIYEMYDLLKMILRVVEVHMYLWGGISNLKSPIYLYEDHQM